MTAQVDLNELWMRIDRIFHGRYEFRGRLGSGGMGMVFLVQARDLGGKFYALKIISKNSPENYGVDVYTEIQILKGLKHPNIVSIFEAVEDEENVYIIQDYIKGRTLAQIRDDRTETGAFDCEAVRLWMIDVAEALAYIHSMNIVHRDVKPGNIMIDSSGSAMLIDFGIARRVSTISRTSTGSTVGSAPYSPLERLQGQADNVQTDIYAYGTTFYSLLRRSVPSVSGREINTLRTSNKSVKPYYLNAYRTMTGDIANIEDAGLRDLIRDCVEIDPSRRIRDFNTVRYRLRSMDQVRQIHRDRKSEYNRKKRIFAALMIAGILLSGLGIVQMKRDHDHKYARILESAQKSYADTDFRQSEEDSEKAIEFDPNNEAGYFARYKAITGAAYETGGKGEYERLINIIKDDVAAMPSLEDSLYTATYLANAYFETGDTASAVSTLSGRSDLEDDQLMLLGHALYLQGEYARAEACLGKMHEDTPQKFYLDGLISQESDTAKALECYGRVLDSEDADSKTGDLRRKALAQMAQLYMDREEYEQAIDRIREWTDKDPVLGDSIKINMMLMDCWFKAGNNERAVKQADAVLERYPDDHAYGIKLSALEKMGRYSQALDTIDQWKEAFPESAAPHVQRVIIYNNIAGAARTDAEMEKTYPDFIRAYEEEQGWLEANGGMNDEFRMLESAYYNAVDTLRRIRAGE